MQIANLSYSPNCLSFEFFKSISEFRIITLLLIYFGIITIDIFNPVNKDNMSPIVSFDQAKKTCSFKPQTNNGKNGLLYNLLRGGGNISKEIKNAGKILSRK